MREWKILCDFDGTVSLADATDELLERHAAPQWRALESQWLAGQIGSRECMSGQVGLIDASAAELDASIDAIAIDPAFPAFVAQAKALGVELVIVSDGLDRVIHRILGNHGLAGLPVVSNHLEQIGERRWRMQSPHADVDCHAQSGTCKCALASAACASILVIGDGQSDVCVSARADFVFAKKRLLDHCRLAGIAHRPIIGFETAIALLPDLMAGRLDTHPASPIPTPVHLAELA